MTLEELIGQTGATMRWDSLRRMGQISRGENSIVFRLDDEWMVLNGQQLVVGGPITYQQGRLIFSQQAVSAIFETLGRIKTGSKYRLSTILIDPGHGGRDTGAIRYWEIDGVKVALAEKDVVLEVSLQLAEKLRSLYPDKDIILTRINDVYPTLEERVIMANNVNLLPREGMIYISIHANASLSSKAEGYEVWYLPKEYRRQVVDQTDFAHPKSLAPIINLLWEEEFTHESITLADMILKGFLNQLGPQVPNRGRREESWFVVRNAKMASVLVEIGFITNQNEAKRLQQPRYLRQISEGIYNGISEFVDYFENQR